VSKGPLAVRFGAQPVLSPQAGVLELVDVELENAGAARWTETVHLAYHWLDGRDNPIVWDGVRTQLPPLAPGERATVRAGVRAPIPPGRYRLALDLIAEHRAWFSELGSEQLVQDLEVAERSGEPHADLPEGVEPGDGYDDRVRAAHAEGYAVVAGSVAWDGGRLQPRPRELAPYSPGGGRVPGFAEPLLCASTLPGVELERVGDVAGLPAYAAPRDEPWIYDARVVLRVRARPRSDRRPT
jgi:hypothetical protein